MLEALFAELDQERAGDNNLLRVAKLQERIADLRMQLQRNNGAGQEEEKWFSFGSPSYTKL